MCGPLRRLAARPALASAGRPAPAARGLRPFERGRRRPAAGPCAGQSMARKLSESVAVARSVTLPVAPTRAISTCPGPFGGFQLETCRVSSRPLRAMPASASRARYRDSRYIIFLYIIIKLINQASKLKLINKKSCVRAVPPMCTVCRI